MKYAITLFVALLFGFQPNTKLYAQHIDNERMNRDIHIMENILKEMFKTSSESHGNLIHISSGTFSFGENDDINGTYLPGYGVIFTIPARSSAFVLSSSTNGNNSSYSFSNGSGGDKKITKDSIINQIKDFLENYGPTIHQLENNDRITVIYQKNQFDESHMFYAFSSTGKNENSEKTELPSTISVTATEAGLEALRKGSISKNQFEDRLTISNTDTKNNPHQDVKVMANIFKTAFEDNGKDSYKISGFVNHSYINDLGALFYIDASYGSGLWKLNLRVANIKKRLSKFKFDSVGVDSLYVKNFSTLDNGKDDAKFKRDNEKAYQQFLKQLKETLVDYGRTLKSVQPNERVLVSVSLSTSDDDLPEHVNLQIKKSELDALDKRSISREQAINQINVREY